MLPKDVLTGSLTSARKRNASIRAMFRVMDLVPFGWCTDLFRMSGQEVDHESCDLVDLLIQCEVAGVNQMNLGVRQVTLVSLRARRDEGGIITPPDNQRRRLVLAQP